MDLGTSCRPWPSECVLGLLLWIRRSFSFVSPLFVCVSGGFLVSFVLPLGFGFVVCLGLFRPVGSAGVGGALLVD